MQMFRYLLKTGTKLLAKTPDLTKGHMKLEQPNQIAQFRTTAGNFLDFFVAERRRYGRSTLTWYYFTVNGEVQNGPDTSSDPWPAVNYPVAQLLWDARRFGYDVIPTPQAIHWAKQMFKKKRGFAIAPEDFRKFVAEETTLTKP